MKITSYILLLSFWIFCACGSESSQNQLTEESKASTPTESPASEPTQKQPTKEALHGEVVLYFDGQEYRFTNFIDKRSEITLNNENFQLRLQDAESEGFIMALFSGVDYDNLETTYLPFTQDPNNKIMLTFQEMPFTAQEENAPVSQTTLKTGKVHIKELDLDKRTVSLDFEGEMSPMSDFNNEQLQPAKGTIEIMFDNVVDTRN